MDRQDFETPVVRLDYDVICGNIRGALDRLSAHRLAHRPHIKAHKSVELAKLQLSMGCRGITCAKLGEAEVMAAAGVDDILLAYPLIGREKLSRLAALMRKNVQIQTILNSVEGAKGLSDLGDALGNPVPVLIEMDGHIGRGGIKAGEDFRAFAKALKAFAGIRVVGVECYGGDIYDCKTEATIRARARQERDEIVECGQVLNELGMPAQVLSGGSSFSILFPEELEGLTEVRAGNYIFNDNALLSIGMISPEACAMTVLATVVAKSGEDVAIIDAGTKTLTSDMVHLHEGYGAVLEHPEAEIFKLNEEHGYVLCPGLRIGDTLTIVPNHACVIPNLYERLPAFRQGRFDHWIAIDARGKNA